MYIMIVEKIKIAGIGRGRAFVGEGGKRKVQRAKLDRIRHKRDIFL